MFILQLMPVACSIRCSCAVLRSASGQVSHHCISMILRFVCPNILQGLRFNNLRIAPLKKYVFWISSSDEVAVETSRYEVLQMQVKYSPNQRLELTELFVGGGISTQVLSISCLSACFNM